MSLWADSANPGGRFGSSRKGPARLEATQRMKEWTRARFHLGDGETVVVTEIARALPGFPPLQTAVAFWTADGTRHNFTVFKPVENAEEGDVPPAWLRDALALSEGVDCACC